MAGKAFSLKNLLLLFFILYLTGCGVAVQDHFSQAAPDTPYIEFTVNARNQFQIKLPKDSGAQEYYFYWADNESMDNPTKIVLSGNTADVDIRGLLGDAVTPGQTVFLAIIATWEGKESGRSNVIAYQFQPDSPNNVKAQTLTGRGEIRWENASGEHAKYNVYWSTTPDVSVTKHEGAAKNLEGDSFTHDQTQYDEQQKVYYIVAKIEEGVESPTSEIVEITVSKTAKVPTPQNLQANVNGQIIDISWKAVESATAYRIYRDTSNELDFTSAQVFEVSNANYDDSSILAGTNYYYWVVALNESGSSEISAPAGPARIAGANTGGTSNLPPEFTIDDVYFIEEGKKVVTNLTAIDIDSNNLSYGVSAGFEVFEVKGAQLSFIAAPDFESNVTSYQVTVTVRDLDHVVEKAITVNVTNVNEPPEFTLATFSYSIPENTKAVTSLSASDVDSSSVLTFSVANADTGTFEIVNGNQLSFVSPPDFDAVGVTNPYKVTVVVKDNGMPPLEDRRELTITIEGVNEPPFVNNEDLLLPMSEGNVYAGKVKASDPEGNTLRFEKIGGADTTALTVDPDDGEIRFVTAPDYDVPGSSDGDNDYHIDVRIYEEGNPGNQITKAFTIRVGAVNEAPVWNTGNTLSVNENRNPPLVEMLSASDAEDSVTYTFAGSGGDYSYFNINGAQLSFNSMQDYENLISVRGSSVFNITLNANDGNNPAVSLGVTITVKDVDEDPIVTPPSNTSVQEPNLGVFQIGATDPEGLSLHYSITPNGQGGTANADSAFFKINDSGVLSFIGISGKTDYETMSSASGSKVFSVEVQVADTASGAGGSVNIVKLPLQITLVNLPEMPYFVTESNLPNQNENVFPRPSFEIVAFDGDGDDVFLNLKSTGDFLDFTLNAAPGKNTYTLAYKNTLELDYESPNDEGGDNTYEITIILNGGGVTGLEKTFTFSVNNLNDNNPVFVTGANALSTPENQLLNAPIAIHDPDGSLTPLSTSIIGGADQAKFSLAGNILSFQTAPDYESPTDSGQNNVYEVTLRVHDTQRSSDRTFNVSVTNQVNSLGQPQINVVPTTFINNQQPANPFERRFWIKWPNVTNATNYFLYYAEQPGITPGNYRTLTNGTKLALGSATLLPNGVRSFKSISIADGRTYYFILTAGDGNEESAASSEQSATTYTPSLVLNDTGIETCATSDTGGLACNNATDGTDLFSPQDAENGRDKARLSTQLIKIGTGQAAFDFTKISSTGNTLGNTASSWSCVKDNVTGLIWEVKTTSGLHNTANTYTWDSAQSFAANVNTENFCGASNWRVPNPEELASIINYSIAPPGPSIDSSFFTNTQKLAYWTSAPVAATVSAGATTSAWSIKFNLGTIDKSPKNTPIYIRLVHD
ncbi:MAG: DUF1566 domain-containing protein [Gammaproteobacteria bacterium]|nr:DUF1566 domain-containing protein [Gammaproteobacteria bacterium]